MNKTTVGNVRRRPQKNSGKSAPKQKLNVKRLAIVAAAAVFIIYFVYAMIAQQIALSNKNKEIQSLEEQVSAANTETERLQKELDNLEDPEYLERVAREKLGLVRPNERVFVDANKSKANSGD